MQIDEIEQTAVLDRVLADEHRGVVLDFWGTWCQPCRTLRPHLERLADDHRDDWRFLAIHVDRHPDLVERYDIMSTPTLVYLRDGAEVRRRAGAATPTTVSTDLTELAVAADG